MKKILWIDDEISSLTSLVLLLKGHNYAVTTVSNGEDGCELIAKESFDLVLLDEIMPGKDGIETLQTIKEINMNIPVVMVTKSDEEVLIDRAYIHRIDDFLIKPLTPNQLISTCKRLLERENLVLKGIPEEYTKFYQRVNQQVNDGLDWREWTSLYFELSKWSIKIGRNRNVGELHTQLFSECERTFAKFIEINYKVWLKEQTGPMLSPSLVSNIVLPNLSPAKLVGSEAPTHPGRVYLFIIDCLRLDQWFVIRPFLEEFYKIKEDFYFSILPTATPFARNAIFSGLFPKEMSEKYPELWVPEENKHEKEFFDFQLKKFGYKGAYIRVRSLNEEQKLSKNIAQSKECNVISVVVNFLDYLIHAKHESIMVDELIPDIDALRAITSLWFSRSKVFEVLKELSKLGDPVIFTTDHGAVLASHPSIVLGSKVISRNLRYKYGPALRCDPKEALFIDTPEQYKLPGTIRYGITKEDYYFIYPTHPDEYEKEYKYTFQHGGISMQEMILPCITLLPK